MKEPSELRSVGGTDGDWPAFSSSYVRNCARAPALNCIDDDDDANGDDVSSVWRNVSAMNREIPYGPYTCTTLPSCGSLLDDDDADAEAAAAVWR